MTEFVDPRGPFRTVERVEQTPSANRTTFRECGHVSDLNPSMAPAKPGEQVRCFQCGPHGRRD